jgi:hypothetical protein
MSRFQHLWGSMGDMERRCGCDDHTAHVLRHRQVLLTRKYWEISCHVCFPHCRHRILCFDDHDYKFSDIRWWSQKILLRRCGSMLKFFFHDTIDWLPQTYFLLRPTSPISFRLPYKCVTSLSKPQSSYCSSFVRKASHHHTVVWSPGKFWHSRRLECLISQFLLSGFACCYKVTSP